MRRYTDEVCGVCGSTVEYCDECYRTFCPSEPAGHACKHAHEDDDDEGDPALAGSGGAGHVASPPAC